MLVAIFDELVFVFYIDRGRTVVFIGFVAFLEALVILSFRCLELSIFLGCIAVRSSALPVPALRTRFLLQCGREFPF